jgi:hypothetical protein
LFVFCSNQPHQSLTTQHTTRHRRPQPEAHPGSDLDSHPPLPSPGRRWSHQPRSLLYHFFTVRFLEFRSKLRVVCVRCVCVCVCVCVCAVGACAR